MPIAPGDDHRALPTGSFPCDGVVVQGEAVFSPCRTWRYRVDYTWDAAIPGRVVWVLLNPSTADGGAFDPTLRRCFGFARSCRAPIGGMIVLNAYGLRATSPKHLRSHPDPVGPENLTTIAAVIAEHPQAPVVCGFGGHADDHPGHLVRLGAALASAGSRLRALNFTAVGLPKHPLYLPGVPQGQALEDVWRPYAPTATRPRAVRR